jgi:hypothetical protein
VDVKPQDCFLWVDDHDTAIAFHRNVLGFEVRNRVSAYGIRWVHHGTALAAGRQRRARASGGRSRHRNRIRIIEPRG